MLLGLRLVSVQSVLWLLFDAAAGCVAYVVLFFATTATPGERTRGLAFHASLAGTVAFSKH